MTTLNVTQLEKGIRMSRYKDTRRDIGTICYSQIPYTNLYESLDANQAKERKRFIDSLSSNLKEDVPEKKQIQYDKLSEKEKAIKHILGLQDPEPKQKDTKQTSEDTSIFDVPDIEEEVKEVAEDVADVADVEEVAEVAEVADVAEEDTTDTTDITAPADTSGKKIILNVNLEPDSKKKGGAFLI